MNVAETDALARRAEAAERAGAAADAARLWDALIGAAPQHPKALLVQGRRLIERGDPARARLLLAEAERADPRDPEAPLNAALAANLQGDLEASLAALDRALTIDPYFFLALLSKGKVLERMSLTRQAARVYANAIKIAPPPERLPQALRDALSHARSAVEANNHALAEHLRLRTAGLRQRHEGQDLARFDECLDILAGTKRRQVQDPILLYFPRLPPIPYYDRALFPWMEALEAQTDAIREELLGVMAEDRAGFAPYIQYPPGSPVNQWAELNHNPDWSTYFLWRDGVRFDANCARCPRTAAALKPIPMAHQKDYGPTAMFSVLAPHKHIPPHTGSSNTRLIAHLPLILPDKCRFRVGNDTRPWRMNEAWVFDDTIEHEAWNDSGETRVVLIFDVWNPLMTDAERELVNEMMVALNDYNSA